MTDNSNANTLGDLGRLIGQLMNWGIYILLAVMYQVFFNVASAQLFESETIKNFYARFQLIIGVFMVFKLAVSILQGIMDPDKFMNPKEGFGNFITRVVISLALLTVIVPINVPDVENANSFEKYLNNDGLLFGTLYSLQDRILSNNTLGILILGTADNATTEESDTSGKTEEEIQKEKLSKSSRIFTSTILKAFLKINLLPAEAREDDDDTKRENWYCGANLGDNEPIVDAYQRLDVDPSTLLSWEVLTADCEINENFLDYFTNAISFIPIFGGFIGNTRYVFAFNWLISAIVGIVFLVILVGFTVDIAVRSIKLAILRLLAPIPIISYIEPKSSKDGMFASWVKALTSTYLDLFLRLAIVYFVIFLIQDMIENGIVITEVGGLVGAFSFIFIMLGLFFFAKMAPKFIQDMLGLKGLGMSNIGLSGILGGGAMLGGGIKNGIKNAKNEGTSVLAGALKGAGAAFAMGAMNGTQGAVQGYNQNKPQSLGNAWSQNRVLMRQITTGDKNAKGVIADWLNYQNRNMAAGASGYGKHNMAMADWNKKRLQKAYGDAKAEYEDAQNSLKAFADMNANMRETDPIRYNEIYSRLYDRVRDARANRDSLEIAFNKASGAAGTIEKYRSDVYQVAPRAMDTTRSTYRSSLEVKNDDPVLDGNGHVVNISSNFKSAAQPFDPYKGEDGIPRVDDDTPMPPPPPPTA